MINLADFKRWEIIGSGGKTTFMLENAKLLAKQKCGQAKVIFTTSTHLAWLGARQPNFYPGRLLECGGPEKGSLEAAEVRWRELNLLTSAVGASAQEEAGRLCGLARLNAERTKWIGFTPGELDRISCWPGLDYLLVEADGSKRLPVKAHATHEPVFYAQADLGVAIIGMQGLGKRVEEGQVHRPELMCQLLHCEPGAVIGAGQFVRLACAYLALLPTQAKVLVFSQAENSQPNFLAELAAQVRKYWNTVAILSQAADKQGQIVYREF
ncbi:TPA: putative selenium-dependent hydroxylase accessory protein YqeC [bacterium UBP9_UBA11836]|nr:putative selenium-dependent hydroxylase accessory protein YqeC [bacterium UBP9_UBA11836]